MAEIKLDNSNWIEDAIRDIAISYLKEVSMELVAQAEKNSIDFAAKTSGTWDYSVNEENLESQVGSPHESAVWEEFGIGEYALDSNTEKDEGADADKDGENSPMEDKQPSRTLWKAYQTHKPKMIKRAEDVFKELNQK